MVIVREVPRVQNSAAHHLPPISLPLDTSTGRRPQQARSPLQPVSTSSPLSQSPPVASQPLLTPQQQQSLEEVGSLNLSRESEDLVEKVEKIYTTLLRDSMGLGFSIAGGLGATPYRKQSLSPLLCASVGNFVI
jgi:hypothetical protein